MGLRRRPPAWSEEMTDLRGKASKPVGTHILTQRLANEILLRPACLLSERAPASPRLVHRTFEYSRPSCDGTEIGTCSPRSPWATHVSCREIDRMTRLRTSVRRALWMPSPPPRSCGQPRALDSRLALEQISGNVHMSYELAKRVFVAPWARRNPPVTDRP